MGYHFVAHNMNWLNRFPSHLLQLQTFKKGLWNADFLGDLVQNQGVVPVFQDLNGFLAEVEGDGVTGEEFHQLAPLCRSLCLDGDRQLIAALYGQDQLLIGSFIVRCMRIYNRHKHDADTLGKFAVLFGALNIAITGPWDDCVLAASFGYATFVGNHTVEVEK